MNDSPSLTENPRSAQPDALPLGGLLALACAGFITILTEAMPAGLLPQMKQPRCIARAGRPIGHCLCPGIAVGGHPPHPADPWLAQAPVTAASPSAALL